jgi:inosine/xanthosine triphosphate pyrophosphatase family protein
VCHKVPCYLQLFTSDATTIDGFELATFADDTALFVSSLDPTPKQLDL